MNRVRAAGTVLWRQHPDGTIEVALVHRPRYDDWSLPKGKLDPGETNAVAAIREVREETGCFAVLGRYLGQVNYSVPNPGGKRPQAKTVEYFSARASGGEFQPGDEVDQLCWTTPERAISRLSYEHDARILGQFTALPPATRTVLLVRHAKAGKRQEWTGDDDLRPLSAAGWEQAAALRVLLPLFGPSEVFSAPRLRCVQTVQGVAHDLGQDVRMVPALSEDEYWRAPERGLARLLEIAAGSESPVICSQGGVIPDMVAALTERYGVGTGQVTSKKGSVWLLSFVPPDAGEEPKLVAADYFPTALPPPDPAETR